jgi:hypothetical protein
MRSNATENALQKQKTKIKAFSKVGKERIADKQFQTFKNPTKTQDSIDNTYISFGACDRDIDRHLNFKDSLEQNRIGQAPLSKEQDALLSTHIAGTLLTPLKEDNEA